MPTRALIAVCALIAVRLSAHAQPDSLRAGVLVAAGGTYVLAFEGAPLAVGSPVTVVATDGAQQVSRATIGKPLEASAVVNRHDLRGAFYELVPEPGSQPLPQLAVVIPGRIDVARRHNIVTLRLTNPPRDVRARSCTSAEGVHLTLWAGAPLQSQRLWHAYYYLGYDVEPTCTPADYRGR